MKDHFMLVFIFLSVLIIGAGVGYVYYTMMAAKKKMIIKVERRYHHHNLLAVDHGDKYNLWAVGYKGIILHSSDSGKTWKRQHSNTNATLADVDFINENEGWAVGRWATILHTKDGGKNWEKQKVPKEVDPHAYLCSVQFLNENEGWACGSLTTLLHTTDGGKSWELIDMSKYVDWGIGFNCVFFTDENNGWIVGEVGTCLHTKDGGKTWETVDLGVRGKTLFCVVFLLKNPKMGFISGTDGVLLYTEDGGKSWIPPEWKDIPVTEHIFKVYFKTSEEYTPASNLGLDVYACGRGILMHTYGFLQKNWEDVIEVELPRNRHVEYTWFRGMTWPTDSIGIVVGEDGLILRSDDEGRKWKSIDYGYEYE